MQPIYFHLSEHIYCCFFKDDLIMLDAIKDQFNILPAPNSFVFKNILGNSFQLEGDSYVPLVPQDFSIVDVNETIKTLRQMGMVKAEDFIYPSDRPLFHSDTGVDNLDWRLSEKKAPFKFIPFVKAYLKLIQVFTILKLRGLFHLLHLIKSTPVSIRISKGNNLTIKNWQLLVDNLNHACRLFPYRIQCLLWSATLSLLAKAQGMSCHFVIGVQNYPFMAHAWVEDQQQQVVADSATLAFDLAVMLRV